METHGGLHLPSCVHLPAQTQTTLLSPWPPLHLLEPSRPQQEANAHTGPLSEGCHLPCSRHTLQTPAAPAALTALTQPRCTDSLVGSVTGLVAEDTSSDTITFEDEAFSLGRNKLVKAFRGEGGVGEGACLEMTHVTGLEVSGSPQRPVCHAQTLSAWQALFLCGSSSSWGKNMSTFPDKRGLIHTSIWGIVMSRQKHLRLDFLKLQLATKRPAIHYPYLFNTLYVPVKTQRK